MRFLLLENSINNKTLKIFLVNACILFNIPGFNSALGEDAEAAYNYYYIHHLNGKDDDNSLPNICLVPRRGDTSHTSYHNKLRKNGFEADSDEGRALFQKEFMKDAVLVGKYIVDVMTRSEFPEGE